MKQQRAIGVVWERFVKLVTEWIEGCLEYDG